MDSVQNRSALGLSPMAPKYLNLTLNTRQGRIASSPQDVEKYELSHPPVEDRMWIGEHNNDMTEKADTQ